MCSWGLGIYGALGHSDTMDQMFPKKIEALDGIPISAVSCGIWHSVVLSTLGDIYVFGSNVHGQIGVGSLKQSIFTTPQLIEVGDGNGQEPVFIKVSSGARHIVALARDEDFYRVYSWGWNGKHQISPDLGEIVASPVNIKSIPADLKRKVDISAGHWSTSIIVSEE